MAVLAIRGQRASAESRRRGTRDHQPVQLARAAERGEPDPARDLPRQGEPVLRSLLREVSGGRGRHRGRHDQGLQCQHLPGRSDRPPDPGADGAATRPRPRVRAGSLLDQRREDERFQLCPAGRGHDGLHAAFTGHAARVLGVRRSLRARGSLLHLDVRAHLPRAPVHGGGTVVRHRRQQDDDGPRGQLLRRSDRDDEALPHRGPHRCGRGRDHEPRGEHHRRSA